MVILGISGRRGVGKTLLASHIVRTCGFTKISFAEELKRLARLFFPFTDAELASPELKEKPYKHYEWSPREFIDKLGQFIRYYDPDYLVVRALAKCTKKNGYYVFDDMRYPNEYDTVKKLGGKVIRINRDWKQNPYGKDLDSISETSLDSHEFDYLIEKFRNNTPDELFAHTENILELWDTE